jgi:glycosyltransferase involved in cell wall biosynthesis
MAIHYLMERLASRCPVVWMNPARDRHTLLQRRGGRADVSGHPNLTVYDHGPFLPELWRPAALASLTRRLRTRRGMQLLRAQGCDRLIAYLWRPRFLSSLKSGRFDFSVYHITDEYSFADHEQPLDPEEVRAIQAVDQVIVHSNGLLEKKGGINPRTELIPNGVDFHRFSAPVPEPSDLAAVPRPRLGYSGWVKRQLDWPLLEELTNRNPQWNFVFAGARSPHEDIVPVLHRLEALPNVHFLGSKPSEELARYPQHFDCCIMPYARTAYTSYIYPLKLHEYLAGGQPVVGTSVRSLAGLGHVIHLAEDRAGWEAAIQRALDPREREPDRVAARQALARQHDWQVLTDRIAKLLGLPREGANPPRAA